jgi:hypothetical protein
VLAQKQVIHGPAREKVVVIRGIKIAIPFRFKSEVNLNLFGVFSLQIPHGFKITWGQRIVAPHPGLRMIRQHHVVGKTENLVMAFNRFFDILLIRSDGMSAPSGMGVIGVIQRFTHR